MDFCSGNYPDKHEKLIDKNGRHLHYNAKMLLISLFVQKIFLFFFCYILVFDNRFSFQICSQSIWCPGYTFFASKSLKTLVKAFFIYLTLLGEALSGKLCIERVMTYFACHSGNTLNRHLSCYNPGFWCPTPRWCPGQLSPTQLRFCFFSKLYIHR